MRQRDSDNGRQILLERIRYIVAAVVHELLLQFRQRQRLRQGRRRDDDYDEGDGDNDGDLADVDDDDDNDGGDDDDNEGVAPEAQRTEGEPTRPNSTDRGTTEAGCSRDSSRSSSPDSPLCPALAALERGDYLAAEGHVYAAHMERGRELEAQSLAARHSFCRAMASRSLPESVVARAADAEVPPNSTSIMEPRGLKSWQDILGDDRQLRGKPEFPGSAWMAGLIQPMHPGGTALDEPPRPNSSPTDHGGRGVSE